MKMGDADRRFCFVGDRAAAAGSGFPYVGVFGALLAEPVWMREVRLGDGSHPGSAGYALLADLVLPTWRTWIGPSR